MKISFFGHYKSYDFYRIGGTDSFIRRLTLDIVKKKNIKIELILYGSENKSVLIKENLKQLYFKELSDSFNYLSKNNFKHIILTWMDLRNRSKYISFTKKNSQIIFHEFHFFYPANFFFKVRKIYELLFYKKSGRNFVVSERQKKLFKLFNKKITLLNPPVDIKYFNAKFLKKNKKIKITFLGRIDPRKGINKVISLFKKIENNKNFEISIYGIHIKEDFESLKIHKWLNLQKKIKYIEVNRDEFSNSIDSMVVDVLGNTDIFVQPYKNLDSTVDSPLLLIEALALKCKIITTKIDSVIDICGKNGNYFQYNNFENDAYRFLKNIDLNEFFNENKKKLKNHIQAKNKYLTTNVANNFMKVLEKFDE